MSDQNNHDDWSNRNWQDAGKFGGGGGNNFGFGGGNQGGFFGGRNNGNNGQNNNQGTSFFGGNRSGKIGGGWMQGRNSMFVIIVVLIIVIIYTFYTQISLNNSITRSTIERTKIESTFDSKNDPCYMDEFNVVDDERAMRDAAKVFHDATGVIPFVYFTASDETVTEAEQMQKADAFYKENFQDQDHFVIFFDGLQADYILGTSVGENAKTVLDDEAMQIFKDYLLKFYQARQTNNQSFMVNTLRYSSERMMTTLPYSKTTLIFGIIVIAILIVAILLSIKKRSDATTNQKPTEGP